MNIVESAVSTIQLEIAKSKAAKILEYVWNKGSLVDLAYALNHDEVKPYLDSIDKDNIFRSKAFHNKSNPNPRNETRSIIHSMIKNKPVTEKEICENLAAMGFTKGGAKSSAKYHIQQLSGDKIRAIVPVKDTNPTVWRAR